MIFPVLNRKYIIITKNNQNNHIEKYTGKCVVSYNKDKNWLFFDVARLKPPYDVKPCKIFTIWDQFCDISEIKLIKERAKNARQYMEKRALDKILKRLINENFEW